MELKKRTRREGGFTLIELISVIIILGILAAVITPKYFDMTERANQASYDAALNEATARLNMSFAKYILDNSAPPPTLGDLEDPAYLGDPLTAVSLGDFRVSYNSFVAPTATTTGTVTLDVTPATGSVPTNVNATKIVQWPGE